MGGGSRQGLDSAMSVLGQTGSWCWRKQNEGWRQNNGEPWDWGWRVREPVGEWDRIAVPLSPSPAGHPETQAKTGR